MDTPKARPILMSAPMVRAILEGHKTQTRRAVKPQPGEDAINISVGEIGTSRGAAYVRYPNEGGICFRLPCPYGQPGDRLWVRETWKYWDWTEDGMPWIKYAGDGATKFFDSCIPEEWSDRVEQVWAELSAHDNYKIDQAARDHKWRPSIFLPRWASRILLEITGVRVERLQDISVSDAIAEGYDGSNPAPTDPSIKWYADLWESLNGSGSWDANPWVWVIEFKRVQPCACRITNLDGICVECGKAFA